MSLKPEPIGPVPQETARIAKAAFPKLDFVHFLQGNNVSSWYDELIQFF